MSSPTSGVPDRPDTPAEPGNIFNRLARLVTGRRQRWGILAFWIVVIAITAPIASRIGEVENNGNKAFLPGSSDSFRAIELQETFDSGDTTAAAIIYHRDSGLTEEDRAKVEADQLAFASANPAFRVTPPVPSEDGLAMLVTVIIPDIGDEQLSADVGALREIIHRDAPDGLEAKVTGPAGIGVDLGKVFKGINGRLLVAAAIVVAVLLLITYRSPSCGCIPLAGRWIRRPRCHGPGLWSGQGVRFLDQRPKRGHHGHPRVRRGHRLRPAADCPLPRRTSPARARRPTPWALRCDRRLRRSWPRAAP